MSKRLTLSEEDIELLVRLIESAISPAKPYNDKEVFAIQRKNQLLAKLNGQQNDVSIS